MSEHDFEPIRGLPAELPKGESILWQGAPDWLALAQRAFHLRSVAIYFAILIVWRAVATGSIAAGIQFAPIAAVCLALLVGLAALIARTTVYTITTKRIVMRFGLALPKAINIPFSIIAAADVRVFGDKSGDVSITLTAPNEINFFLLWPHARPWRLTRPQPTLRALAQVSSVADTLSNAIRAAQRAPAASVATEAAVALEPVLSPA